MTTGQRLPSLLDALLLVGEVFKLIKMEAKKHPNDIPIDPCVVIEKALSREGDLRTNLRAILQEENLDVDAVIDYASTLEQFLQNRPPVDVYKDKGNFDLPSQDNKV